MTEQTIPVTGLSCDRCVETVTEQLTGVDGIETVTVDEVRGGTSTVRISADREIDDETLQAALTRGGAFTIRR